MAASSSASLPHSHATSSLSSSKRSHRSQDDRPESPSLPVETLVNHVLAAKQSLSSMTLVLRANELADSARRLQQDASIQSAHTEFISLAIFDQATILIKLRKTLRATYRWGERDFKKLIASMDEVDGELEHTIEMLRRTRVQKALRPEGEEPRSLLDFVDETSVHSLRDEMKDSIQEFQVCLSFSIPRFPRPWLIRKQSIQQSFDSDLLRFDTDIQNLMKSVEEARISQSQYNDDNEPTPTPTELLYNLVDHSANMAQLLASLTNHFDMCVTAIRTTDGAAALARRKAAIASDSTNNPVSLSGVIAEQESHQPNLEPETPQDRAEMLKVVIQDALEVPDVVHEIHDRLTEMETQHTTLRALTTSSHTSHLAILSAYALLCEMGDRLPDYIAAEGDFRNRWEIEKDVIYGKLEAMREMREFYDGYASAYDGLVMEVERRKVVEDKVAAMWKKTRDGVEKLLDQDQSARDKFRSDVGEFLPTDLWEGMQGSATRWKVVPVVGDVEDGGKRDS